jgi:hypothetical protein
MRSSHAVFLKKNLLLYIVVFKIYLTFNIWFKITNISYIFFIDLFYNGYIEEFKQLL